MHHNRRKKKRINYGVRAVELFRGTKGYGFTISGQQPCILSCIVTGSPAEQSGLRAGDYLVAVNGYNVAKSPHDDVVKLIGNSKGILRLQIAENYYSDSSDEEGHLTARTKPKYSHKTRTSNSTSNNNHNHSHNNHNHNHNYNPNHSHTHTHNHNNNNSNHNNAATSVSPNPNNEKFKCTVDKVVNDLKTGAMFELPFDSAQTPGTETTTTSTGTTITGTSTVRLPPPPPPQLKMQCSKNGSCHRYLNLKNSICDNNLGLASCSLPCSLALAPPPLNKRETEKIVHRTVVGYLGTIDIPNQLHSSMMMQVLKKCIKRLKQEKRNPITVLLTIHVTNIKLTNADNKIIAEYPSYRIIFCNAFSDTDKQYFGILTKSTGDRDGIVSNSCHVFMIFNRLIDHSLHVNTSNIFGFTCTKTTDSMVCQEFPDSCMGLIGAIQTLYIVDGSNDENGGAYGDVRRQLDAVSPQPSNVSSSTAHSSNSDSGIGFRDDYAGNQGERNGDIFRQPFPVRIALRAGGSGTGVGVGAGGESGAKSNDDNDDDDDDDDGPWIRRTEPELGCKGIDGIGLYEGRNIFDGQREKCGEGNTCVKTSAAKQSVGTSSFSRTIAGIQRSEMEFPVADGSCCSEIFTMGEPSEDFSCDDSRARNSEMCNKLSPKVFNVAKSLVHSLENLKGDDEQFTALLNSFAGKSYEARQWTSLQEIRNLDEFQSDSLQYGSTDSCDKEDNNYGVHTWASGFEKLLKDPVGLQTFAEFLKKEFSHENIYFWAACERYRNTEDITNRRALAWKIYQRHLSTTAAEPVNVDSHAAGQITQELINYAPADLFLQAQKQVFNLMKFDSYPRFLRSDLYRNCLETGSSVVSTEDCDLALTNSPSVKLKKSHSDAEDRRRKSILPWNRKNRSKSKDRGESEYNKIPTRVEPMYKSFSSIKRDNDGNNTSNNNNNNNNSNYNNNDDNISISSSRSSLASWDLALRQSFSKHSVASYDGQNDKKDVHSKCTGLCRVILPDGSTTVVPTSQTETIKDVITRLLDKRALKYLNYDVLILATDELMNLKYSSSVLAGQEVEVVPAKVLKVDLPSRRIITVVAHRGRTLKEVLRPLLNKYGFKLELITIWGDGHPISLDIPAINAPARLVLTSNNEDFQRDVPRCQDNIPQGQTTLDEITNKVFEELLVGKSANKYQSEGSCKSDDQRSEGSSILSNKFFSRDLALSGKKKSKSKSSNLSEKSNSDCTGDDSAAQSTRSHAPLIAKWRNGVKLQLPGRFDGDELYEGLKRAQRSRLEDQRGTEINFELPDFLKDKENNKSKDEKKLRRARLTVSANCDPTTKFYNDMSSNEKKQNPSSSLLKDSVNKLSESRINNKSTINSYPQSPSSSSLSLSVSDQYKNSMQESSTNKTTNLDNSLTNLDVTLEDADKTIIDNSNCKLTCKSIESSPTGNTSMLSMSMSMSVSSTSSSSGLMESPSTSPTKLLKPPPLPPKPKGLLTNAAKTNHLLSMKNNTRTTTITSDSCENKNIF
ncbi:regulator of G-protein signaling loco isoform X1 [Microplitis demolitor]|uniref:regulator of G-protein signaling loco isoform X1 n=1 Tax=Microplitis demolitor TaxID=69319 RepID=UPI0004CD2B5B|nr:regulator of G-protein signaling loco isoform X1 [Microplitis demolitor]